MERSKPQSGGSQKVAAALIGILGSGILFSAGFVVPLLGFIAAFLAPVPLGFARIRGGSAVAYFSALFTTLLLAVLFSPPIGAWYAVQCGTIGLLVPAFLLNGFSASRTLLWSTAASVALTTVLVIAFSLIGGINPQLFVQQEITSGINQVAKLYEQQPGLSAQDVDNLRQGMESVGQLMSRIYPALITINLGLVSAICLALFRRMATRYELTLELASFNTYKTPDLLVWLLIAAGFASLLPSTLVTTPALNILTVLSVPYFMQGLAVLLTNCDRTGFAATLKTMLFVVLLTQPYLAFIVVALGIFDYWGDFRTPRTTQKENL